MKNILPGLILAGIVVLILLSPGSDSGALATSSATGTTVPTFGTKTPTPTYGPTPGFMAELSISYLKFSDEDLATLTIELAPKAVLYSNEYAPGERLSADPASGPWGRLTDVDCDGTRMGDVIYQVATEWKTWAEKEGLDVNNALRAGLTLFATETNFRHFQPDGEGNCEAYGNLQGAPAFGISQIYRPAHPTFDYDRLDRDRAYGIFLGISVYNGFYNYSGRDWVQAAACYKGFCAKNDTGKDNPAFISNFMPTYNNEGRNFNDTFVPFGAEVFSFLEGLGYDGKKGPVQEQRAVYGRGILSWPGGIETYTTGFVFNGTTHFGLDVYVSPPIASCDGTITRADTHYTVNGIVAITCDDDTMPGSTLVVKYMHLDPDSYADYGTVVGVHFVVGQPIADLALSGNCGTNCSGRHLHLQVEVDSYPQDPQGFFSARIR